MTYSIFLIVGLCFSIISLAQSPTSKQTFTQLDKIIAIVNKEVITQSQFNKEYERVKKQLEQTNQPLPAGGELRKQVLESVIAKNLQIQMCKEKNLVVEEEELEKAIAHVASANKLNSTQLKEAVEHTGINFNEYKAQIREQILLQKLQQEEVTKTVSFTQQDVKTYLKDNKDKLNVNHYSAFHVIDILLPLAENASSIQAESLKKQANEAASQLRKGVSIDSILKQYPSAQNDDLGWRSLGEFPSLFQEKIAAMNVKSISAPVQAPNGLHILKLVEAKGENAKPSESDIKNLAFQYKVSLAVKDWIDKIRKDAYVQVMN